MVEVPWFHAGSLQPQVPDPEKFALVDDLAGRDAEVLDDPVLYFGRTPADIVLNACGFVDFLHLRVLSWCLLGFLYLRSVRL